MDFLKGVWQSFLLTPGSISLSGQMSSSEKGDAEKATSLTGGLEDPGSNQASEM